MVTRASSQKYVLIVVSLAAFITPFMGSAVNLAIPAIGRDFAGSAYQLGWLATGYILASAAFLVPFGRLADIIGRKKVFLAGIFTYAVTSLFCSLSWSIGSLIFFRVLQGVGGAMIFGTSMAILTSVFPPQDRGRVLGINAAMVYTGLSLGPVIGGIVTKNFGWHAIFYIITLISAAAALITVLRLKEEWAGAKGEPFDLLGTLLYAFGLVAALYGISSIDTVPGAGYLSLAGIILLLLFGFYELRIPFPLLNLRLFRNVAFAFSNLAALINYSTTAGLGFLLSLYLQVVIGLDPQLSGMILLSQPVMMAILSPFAGTLSDRVEPRTLSSLGMGCTAVGLFIFSFISAQTSLWSVIATLALMGVGFALFSSPNSNAVMSSVEKKYYGVASSTLGTMRLTGQALSLATVTLIITVIAGNIKLDAANGPALLPAMRFSFGFFAALSLLGVAASLARGKVARP